jgi:hypothetical protein
MVDFKATKIPILAVIIIFLVCSTAGCTRPMYVPTTTPVPPVPPVPTSSLKSKAAVKLDKRCWSVVDGMDALTKDLELPVNLLVEKPYRLDSDFDPNQFFQVLTHLNIKPGYTLDYVYYNVFLGGSPLVYARKSNAVPFQSYRELLESYDEEIPGEQGDGGSRFTDDYLEQIQLDHSPESYFEFVTLALLGDQFYLRWHAGYDDTLILCNKGDGRNVEEEMLASSVPFSKDIKDRIKKVDFRPVVLMGKESVTVRFVTFTKWGGFFEHVLVLDKDDPMHVLDAQVNQLIEYDCGIMY